MVNIENIGKLIQEERKRKGLGVTELANMARVTRRSIQYWESGNRGISLESADKVLKALGVSIAIGETANRIGGKI